MMLMQLRRITQNKRLWVYVLFAVLWLSAIGVTGDVWGATNNIVNSNLDYILSIYPSNSYFSTDGKACNHPNPEVKNICNNCDVWNVPARGLLPKGSKVGSDESWTCVGFAKYAFYCATGAKWGDKRNTIKTGVAYSDVYKYASPGDYISYKGHAGVYIKGDASGYYLYESNYSHPNRVMYCGHKHKNGPCKIVHAYNYDSPSVNWKNVNPAPQVTSTRTVADGEYHIVSKVNSSYGLGVAFDSTESGQNIQISTQTGEADTIALVQVTYMSDGYYKLTMKNSGKVLDVEGGGMDSGTNVQQYNDNGSDAQRWAIQETGDGWFYLVSKRSGMYLDVYDGKAEDYQNVWVYRSNATDAQKWRFTASGLSTGKTIDEGEYHVLTDLNTDYAADISASSQDDQASLLLWERREADRQIFTFKYLGNGYYSITAKHSGKVLEASHGGTYNQTNVVQHTWNGSDAQKWIVKRNSDGTYCLVNKASGLYMDVYNGDASNLTNIWLYLPNETSAQRWKLVKHDPCTCSGHAWNTTYTVDKAATCAAGGTKSIHCSRCNARKDVQSIPKLAHKWNAGVVTKAAVCAAAGTKTYTCTVCKTIRTESIPMLGHTAGAAVRENVKPASCAGAGSYDEVVRCTRCSAQLSRKTISVPAFGHSWDSGSVVTAATTSSAGKKVYHCTSCTATKEEILPQLAANQPVPLKQAPALKSQESAILTMSGDEAPAAAVFNLLQLKASKVTRTSITLKWKKVAGASGYVIYGNRCGNKYKKIKTISKGSTTSWTKKKLLKGKYYKFFIVAIAKDGNTDKVIASSKTIHIATSGGKVGNDKSVKLTNIKNSKKTLKAGKTFTIKAKPVPASSKLTVKRHRTLRYESTNPAVASVGKTSGKITAKKAGKCTIYVYAQSGAFKAIKITVK